MPQMDRKPESTWTTPPVSLHAAAAGRGVPQAVRIAMQPEPVPLSDYQSVADLRAALRKFLRVSESAARRHGLTQQRYLLLMIKGAPDGSQRSTVTALSDRRQTTRPVAPASAAQNPYRPCRTPPGREQHQHLPASTCANAPPRLLTNEAVTCTFPISTNHRYRGSRFRVTAPRPRDPTSWKGPPIPVSGTGGLV